MNRWPVDNCVGVFLEETGINPDIFDVSGVKVRCRHISASVDGGKSIRKYGLLKLTEVLERDTPVSAFLKDNGIRIIPSKHQIVVNDTAYSIPLHGGEVPFGCLSSKLYYDKGEIEVFISGEEEDMVGYSCIRDCPEILYTLDDELGYNDLRLQHRWTEKKTDLLLVQFDVGFDEIIIHTLPNARNDITKYYEIEQFLSQDYERDEIPKRLWQNYWIILSCLNNATTYGSLSETYAAILPDVQIGKERISVTALMDEK